MLLTNCLEKTKVTCNCTVQFKSYTSPSYGVLKVGNLIGLNCSISKYVIDWHINSVDGPILFTSGTINTNSDITRIHPLNEPIIIYDNSVTYYPVLRYIETGGNIIYSKPTNCHSWCESLYNTLPTITVNKVMCSTNFGGSDDYPFGMNYSPVGIIGERNRTEIFFLDIIKKYVAIYFYGDIESDRITIYYHLADGTLDPITPIIDYDVGFGLTGSDDTSSPKKLDQYGLKIILNLSSKTIVDGDYLEIVITPSTSSNTSWTFQIKCLYESELKLPNNDWQCEYLNTGLRDFDFSNLLELSFDNTNCSYTLNLSLLNPIVEDFFTSNFYKYNEILDCWLNISTKGSFPTYVPTTGAIIASLNNRIYTTIDAACTNDFVSTSPTINARYSFKYNPFEKTLHFIYYHLDDYTNMKNYHWNVIGKLPVSGNIVNSLYVPKTDPLTPECITSMQDIWYYRNAYIRTQVSPMFYDEQALNCGDIRKDIPIHFHPSSPVTFTTDWAELRFTKNVINSAYTAPTIYSSAGLTGISIDKVIADESRKQVNTITITGSSGTLTLHDHDGFERVVTFNGSLSQTVQDFVKANAASFLTKYNVSLTCSQPNEFIGVMRLDLYDGIREDFDTYFVPPTAEELLLCDNSFTYANDVVNTQMDYAGWRYLEINVKPTVDWVNGDIVTGMSSGAHCTIVKWNDKKRTDTTNGYTRDSYFVTDIVGTFLSNEVIGVVGNLNKQADQGVGFPIISTAKEIYSANTGCMNRCKINGYKLFRDRLNELSNRFYYGYYFPLKSLNTICSDMSAWQETIDNKYIFYIFDFKLELTNLDWEVGKTPEEIQVHRTKNFKILSYLDRNTGETLATPVRIYERNTTGQIFP